MANLSLTTWFAIRLLERHSAGHPAVPVSRLPAPVQTVVSAISPQDEDDPSALELITPSGVVNVLILGIDQRFDQQGEPTRSDVMMILRVDFDRQSAKLLSFPRDSWLPIPEVDAYQVAEGRINQAFYYGEKFRVEGAGPGLAMRTVELNFGIPIDHYVLVTFDGFKKIVDALSGIDIYVPKRIYDPAFPTDDYGTMVLEIEPGWHHMDGAQALRYARTRHQDNDTKRILRQQEVLMAIREKALQINAVSRWPELLLATRDAFETDMSVATMVSYALAGQSIGKDSIQTFAVQQTELIPWTSAGGAHVWILRREKVGEIVEAFMARDGS